jgi:CHAT domain-containing protein/Tfp pilus assembly protein PilF
MCNTVKSISPYLSLVWLWSLFGVVVASQNPPAPQPLELNQSIVRELAGGQRHVYQLTLAAGQYLEAVVEQRGVDVVVNLVGPDGKPAAQFDSDSRNQGQETIAQVVEAAGNYRLEVAARRPNAPAGSYAIRLVALRAATGQDQTLQEAARLSAEALRLAGVGELDEALPLATRVLELREQALGAEHPETAVALNRLANLYRNKRDLARAEPLYLRALAIAEQQPAPGHPDLAQIFNDLGGFYILKSDLAQAEARLQRALEIWEQTLGPEHPNLARALTNLGNVYNQKGEVAKAKSSLERALTIRERELGAEHPQLLSTLIGLGGIAYDEGDYERAAGYDQRTLVILEKTEQLETEQGAGVLNNLGTIANFKRDFAQAETLYRRAQAVYEKIFGPEHPLFADQLLNLGTCYVNQGRYAEAEPLYKNALAITEKALGTEHPDVSFILYMLARLYAARGDTAQSAATQARAVAISERNLTRSLGAGSEREKLALLGKLVWENDRTISLHTRVAPNNAAASRLALTAILQRKGRALDIMADDLAALRRRATPEDLALLRQLQATRAELARLALGGPQQMTRAEQQTRITQLEEQRDRLEAEVSRRHAEFRSPSQPVTLAAVQRAIPAGAVLIEFAAYRAFNPKYKGVDEEFNPARYAAYVLRQRGAARWVDLGEREKIDAAVNDLRQALRDRKRRDVQRLARRVDRLVMQPLRPLLGVTRRVFVAPDGQLNLLPFAALVDERNQYLIHRYVFSYLTSGRDLLRLRARQARPQSGQRAQQAQQALIVANPDFGESAASIATERILVPRYRPASPTAETGTLLTEVYFPALPGTDGEAQALKSLLPDATVLLGRAASKTALQQAAAPTILHIATHGFFLGDATGGERGARSLREGDAAPITNPLLRSGLALSGANQLKRAAAQADDGILSALEAASLDLWSTQLVVLSACDTGVGEVKTGEGVYGLRRALVLAGSEAQVLSLWPVNDLATRDLMIEYYRRLQQSAGRTEALREAQLQLLRRGQVGGQDFGHPYYWASFIQSGEWASLEQRTAH